MYARKWSGITKSEGISLKYLNTNAKNDFYQQILSMNE